MSLTENCSQDYVSLREDNSTGKKSQSNFIGHAHLGKEILPPTCTYRNVNQGGYYLSGNGYLKFQSNSSALRINTQAFCLNRKCGFEMEFSVSKFECGGLITDDEGEQFLQTDNRNKIIPGLKCKWDFRAGIGYRYRIEFFFLGENPDDHVSF